MGFILSAVGAAVGLGNIWGFPTKMVKFGGPAFLIPYIIAVVLVGLPFLILEINLGARWRQAPAKFYGNYLGKAGRSFAWFQAGMQLLIGTYYAVIISWVLLSFGVSFTSYLGEPGFYDENILGKTQKTAVSSFSDMGKIQPLVFVGFLFTILLSGFIVSFGVDKGIERVNKVVVPFLFVLIFAIFFYSFNLNGASEGLDFIFKPDISKLEKLNAWKAAFSQAVFTLSLAVSVIIVYSIHAPKNGDNTSRAITIMSGDTLIAVLACVIIGATLGYAQSQDIVLLENGKVWITNSGEKFSEFNAQEKIDMKGILVDKNQVLGTENITKLLYEGAKIKGIEKLEGGAFVFKVFPFAFKSMNDTIYKGLGNIIAVSFYLAIFFAAISSMISILEPAVSNFEFAHNIRRRYGVLIVCFVQFVCGMIFTFQNGEGFVDISDAQYTGKLLLISLIVMGVMCVWNKQKFKEILVTNNRHSRFKLHYWFRYLLILGIILSIVVFVGGVVQGVQGMKKINAFQWGITSIFYLFPFLLMVFGLGFNNFWLRKKNALAKKINKISFAVRSFLFRFRQKTKIIFTKKKCVQKCSKWRCFRCWKIKNNTKS